MARTMWSPLRLLICAVVFFSTNVFAASAVLGVDLGTEFIKAALVKPGIPLEIVLTKDSRRKEISAVAFKPPQNGPKPNTFPERLYGSDAMALSARFPGDVYPNLKTLLGLPADHATVKEYAERHPALQLGEHALTKSATLKSKGAFTAEEEAWLVEDLLAMELQSIRRNAEALAGSDTTVRSVVLTVPPFYTLDEKRAIELAAELAGLRVLSLVTDGLAVGLNYATSRQFPNIKDGAKPEHHMVFDMGAGSTKATVMKFQSRTVKDIGKFNKTIQEVQVLGSGWDRTLGGDTLNSLIVDDMISKFVDTSGAKKVSATIAQVKAHGRAVAKLSKEAERLRHVLSANINAGASFEGLFEDVDFKYKLSRAEFEAMAELHADRVAAAINGALEMADLKDVALDSVILHGGATRTPFVQKQLEKIFGGSDKLRSNVNSDESAVFGAAFRAAELSPSFRVKEIRIADGAVYPVSMKWTNQNQKTQTQRLWTATSHLGATPKEVPFNNREDFGIDFSQQVPSTTGSEEKPIKLLATKNLTETITMLKEKYSCDPSAVQFKIGLRLSSEDGEVEVTKMTVECEAEELEKEGIMDGVKNLFGFGKNKDQQPLKEGESSEIEPESSSSSTTTSTTTSTETASSRSSTESAKSDSKPAEKKKLTVTIPIKYELTAAGAPQLSKADVTAHRERLKLFEASDRSRRQREEALNQLEGFTYKVRDFLDSESFIAASTEEERATLEKKSSDASEWLYGEGADASKEDLKKRHKELQDIVTKVQTRIEDNTKRPELVKGLKDALNQTDEFVKQIRKQIAEYEAFQSSASASSTASPTTTSSSSAVTPAASEGDFAGLEDDDASSTAQSMEYLEKERGPVPPMYTVEDLKDTEEAFKTISAWLEEKEAAQAKLGPTDDSVLTTKDLTAKRERLDKVGMELAMKGVKNFERTQKKSKTKTKTKTKKSKATSSSSGDTEPTIKEGKGPSIEEIEEALKKLEEQNKKKADQAEKKKAGGHDEL
jgi:hypoxia up-regulated 1